MAAILKIHDRQPREIHLEVAQDQWLHALRHRSATQD
jgi:hypothetical protein